MTIADNSSTSEINHTCYVRHNECSTYQCDTDSTDHYEVPRHRDIRESHAYKSTGDYLKVKVGINNRWRCFRTGGDVVMGNGEGNTISNLAGFPVINLFAHLIVKRLKVNFIENVGFATLRLKSTGPKSSTIFSLSTSSHPPLLATHPRSHGIARGIMLKRFTIRFSPSNHMSSCYCRGIKQ